MPFKSSKQRKLCYLLQKQGKASSWNCKEWDKETANKKALPKRVSPRKKR